MSSLHWWVAPSSPTVIPAWVAPILTLLCGGGDHIVLGNTAVEEAIRERLLERTGLGGSGEVSVQNNEVRIDRAEFRQSLTVGFSCSNFISHNYM